MFNVLIGKKTYAVAIIAAAAAAATALDHPVPEWALIMMGAAGLGAVRQAIGR